MEIIESNASLLHTELHLTKYLFPATLQRSGSDDLGLDEVDLYHIWDQTFQRLRVVSYIK